MIGDVENACLGCMKAQLDPWHKKQQGVVGHTYNLKDMEAEGSEDQATWQV